MGNVTWPDGAAADVATIPSGRATACSNPGAVRGLFSSSSFIDCYQREDQDAAHQERPPRGWTYHGWPWSSCGHLRCRHRAWNPLYSALANPTVGWAGRNTPAAFVCQAGEGDRNKPVNGFS